LGLVIEIELRFIRVHIRKYDIQTYNDQLYWETELWIEKWVSNGNIGHSIETEYKDWIQYRELSLIIENRENR